MPTIHFLNVNPGDCTIIQHGSGHVSMIDICDGNLDEALEKSSPLASLNSLLEMVQSTTTDAAGGDFKMRYHLTNPINYAQSLGINNIFRFILSHPDMDHMDGLKTLYDKIGITNFWDAGLNRKKPDFNGNGPYREEDWDQYKKLSSGNGACAISSLAGHRFKYANLKDDGTAGGDGLYILAPTSQLIASASENEDPNDASYVLLYRSCGGRILLPGDAHDATWEYILENYEKDIANCSVMIAPHHGRDSGRLYDFLDKTQPKLTLFGNADSEHLGYHAWRDRELAVITSNQAGNIVLEAENGFINVYVENDSFAKARGKDCSIKNNQGYILFQTIPNTPEGQSASATTKIIPSGQSKTRFI